MSCAALARLPCCTTKEDGTEIGDPLNVVLVGRADDIFPALIRRGWQATEVVWSGSLWRTVRSFLQGSRYRYSPISPLYVFGRPQDIGAQKARRSIHERNHARFWLSPIRFRGQEVWIGQISRDVGSSSRSGHRPYRPT
jgi:LssY C-terminus